MTAAVSLAGSSPNKEKENPVRSEKFDPMKHIECPKVRQLVKDVNKFLGIKPVIFMNQLWRIPNEEKANALQEIQARLYQEIRISQKK